VRLKKSVSRAARQRALSPSKGMCSSGPTEKSGNARGAPATARAGRALSAADRRAAALQNTPRAASGITGAYKDEIGSFFSNTGAAFGDQEMRVQTQTERGASLTPQPVPLRRAEDIARPSAAGNDEHYRTVPLADVRLDANLRGNALRRRS
jgi:hypothetical protein